MTHDPLDQVVLVDELDNQIGIMDKTEAHRGQAQLHRAISVYLFNKHGQLLIQQRSQKKIVGAGQWANTCCGNVRPGESYKECAERRLREELGIEGVALTPVLKFQYFAQCNHEFSEHEIDQVFVGNFDGEVHPHPVEVQATAWVELEEIVSSSSRYELAPWFVMMLENYQVRQKLYFRKGKYAGKRNPIQRSYL
jgi:isopentenyl-diphosphate delta-isomerase